MDGNPVFPEFINNVFTIITVILGINMQYLCFAFCMQVGLIVANAVDGLVVVDGPPDFPK